MRSEAVTVMIPILAVLAGCGDESQDVQRAMGALIPPGVAVTNPAVHPEVGFLQRNDGATCSGTLIRSHWFLTASHCFQTDDAVYNMSGGTVTFVDRNNITHQVTFSKAYRLGVQVGGANPINGATLVRLDQDILGSTIVPATLSLRDPTVGEAVQVLGYGCNDRSMTMSGGGTKRIANVTWPTNVLCPGDSGGALFLSDGTLAGENEAEGSASTPDQYGDLVDRKWSIEALIRQQDNNIEYYVDRGGNDYSHQSASTADACKALCTKDKNCRAFSWQIAEQTCWFKNGLMKLSFNDDVHSGVPDEYIAGYSSQGNDITSFVSTDLNYCHAQCSGTANCVAWAVNYNTGRCYIKSAVTPVATSNVTLGILRTAESNTDRVGGDYGSLSAASVSNCVNACAGDVKCQAWAFLGGRCYFKSIIADGTVSSGVQSGYRRGLRFFEDYSGSDLKQISLPTPGCPDSSTAFCTGNTNSFPRLRPQVCQQACQTTTGCQAWTMDLQSSICYLKNGIPARIAAVNSITGTRATAVNW